MSENYIIKDGQTCTKCDAVHFIAQGYDPDLGELAARFAFDCKCGEPVWIDIEKIKTRAEVRRQ